MPLVFTLAFRNLFHDRLRLVATVIGIVFSIVLVMVQMGLYLGFGRMVTTMIDNASADLWVMPKGTKCFEDPSLLDARPEIRQQTVRVAAVTNGIRSFTTTPYVFMDVDRARSYTGVPSSKATYFLVHIERGSNVGVVRTSLQSTLGNNVEVLTPSDF